MTSVSVQGAGLRGRAIRSPSILKSEGKASNSQEAPPQPKSVHSALASMRRSGEPPVLAGRSERRECQRRVARSRARQHALKGNDRLSHETQLRRTETLRGGRDRARRRAVDVVFHPRERHVGTEWLGIQRDATSRQRIAHGGGKAGTLRGALPQAKPYDTWRATLRKSTRAVERDAERRLGRRRMAAGSHDVSEAFVRDSAKEGQRHVEQLRTNRSKTGDVRE